jgi:hypothetical protein
MRQVGCENDDALAGSAFAGEHAALMVRCCIYRYVASRFAISSVIREAIGHITAVGWLFTMSDTPIACSKSSGNVHGVRPVWEVTSRTASGVKSVLAFLQCCMVGLMPFSLPLAAAHLMFLLPPTSIAFAGDLSVRSRLCLAHGVGAAYVCRASPSRCLDVVSAAWHGGAGRRYDGPADGARADEVYE